MAWSPSSTELTTSHSNHAGASDERCAGGLGLVRVVAELAPVRLDVPEEDEGEVLLAGSEHADRELAALLEQVTGAGILLHPTAMRGGSNDPCVIQFTVETVARSPSPTPSTYNP